METLKESDVPTTLIWGELDAIAPVAVPDQVWTNYLENRPASTAYWRIPCADHYLQVDQAEWIADVLRATMAEGSVPSDLGDPDCPAMRVY